MATLERWEKLGIFKLADNAIKAALLNPRTAPDMARYVQDQQIGKASQAHTVEGTMNLDVTGYALAWDKQLKK